jgi:hypothetical protein
LVEDQKYKDWQSPHKAIPINRLHHDRKIKGKSMMAHYITKSVLAFLVFLVAMSAAASENHTITNANNTSLVTAIKTDLDTFGDILFSFIRILFGGIIFLLLLGVALWIKRDDHETLILPFEVVKSEDKYNGNAIADLLIAELQRI